MSQSTRPEPDTARQPPPRKWSVRLVGTNGPAQPEQNQAPPKTKRWVVRLR